MIALVVLVLPLPVTTAPQAAEYDVILRNGTVIDGTGHPRYLADVATRNGRIVRVGDLAETFRLVDGGVALEMVESGLVQTGPEWASWTGMVRIARTGAVRAVTVVVDRVGRDSTRPGTAVIVNADDGYRMTGRMLFGRGTS